MVATAALVAAVGYGLLTHNPNAITSRLWLDIGLIVAQGAIALHLSSQGNTERQHVLREATERAHSRLNAPTQTNFLNGDLDNLDDPNLGEVRVKQRDTSTPMPTLDQPRPVRISSAVGTPEKVINDDNGTRITQRNGKPVATASVSSPTLTAVSALGVSETTPSAISSSALSSVSSSVASAGDVSAALDYQLPTRPADDVDIGSDGIGEPQVAQPRTASQAKLHIVPKPVDHSAVLDPMQAAQRKIADGIDDLPAPDPTDFVGGSEGIGAPRHRAITNPGRPTRRRDKRNARAKEANNFNRDERNPLERGTERGTERNVTKPPEATVGDANNHAALNGALQLDHIDNPILEGIPRKQGRDTTVVEQVVEPADSPASQYNEQANDVGHLAPLHQQEHSVLNAISSSSSDNNHSINHINNPNSVNHGAHHGAHHGALLTIGSRLPSEILKNASQMSLQGTHSVNPTPNQSQSPTRLSLPDDAEIARLFTQYIEERRRHAIDSDEMTAIDTITSSAFADTIRAQIDRILADHHCRGIRFEVTTVDNIVSLRPRIIR